MPFINCYYKERSEEVFSLVTVTYEITSPDPVGTAMTLFKKYLQE